MTKQPPATVMACDEYQKLYEESVRAREAWSDLRTEICRAQFVQKETVDELLRLQANYARAYSLLQKHTSTCLQCQPASRIA